MHTDTKSKEEHNTYQTLVGPLACQEHTDTHKKRGRRGFTRLDKMPTFPGQKRKIY